jgi:hypothetical protein
VEDLHDWLVVYQYASAGPTGYNYLSWRCGHCIAQKTFCRLNGTETFRFLPAPVGEGCEDKLVEDVMVE